MPSLFGKLRFGVVCSVQKSVKASNGRISSCNVLEHLLNTSILNPKLNYLYLFETARILSENLAAVIVAGIVAACHLRLHRKAPFKQLSTIFCFFTHLFGEQVEGKVVLHFDYQLLG